MLVENTIPPVMVTSALGVLAWGLPLVLLITLVYCIEKYTKFKTRWKLLLPALAIVLAGQTIISYDLWSLGSINPWHETVGNTLLLTGILTGAYTCLTLLRFQNISIGKTRDIVEVVLTAGVVVPAIAFIDGRLSTLNAWNLFAYNTSVALLIIIFLVIGKTIRNYIPRQGRLTYALVVFASMLLPLNLAARAYSYVYYVNFGYGSALMLFGVLMQSAGNVFLAAAVFILIREAKIRGMHIMPSSEEKTDKKPIQYRLKKGFSYMIHEIDCKKGFEIFSDHVAYDYRGLGITRTKPDRIRQVYGMRTTPVLWVTSVETEHKSIRPNDLERLSLIIRDFIANQGNFLFIERLDFFVAENGFEKTLNFIHRMNDLVMCNDCILLVSMNLNTLAFEQRAQLLQDFESLEDLGGVVLSEPLYEVLDFVYSENNSGRRPSFKTVTQNFNITKTTTRRRLFELERLNLVRVIEEGKFKLLEVTQRGGDVLLSPVGPRGW